MKAPACRQAFAPFIESGFLAVAYGGIQEGEFLVKHKLVKSVHLTGSAATYDAIVWGGKPKVDL